MLCLSGNRDLQYIPTDILDKNASPSHAVLRGIRRLGRALGFGRPVIAMGSDIDLPAKTSQKPGISWREQLVECAPGSCRRAYSGQSLNFFPPHY